MDVSIIIISWKVRKLLNECLTSIFQNTKNLDFEVFVVDNNSQDGTIEMIRKNFPSVTLIVNDKNFGFAKANNQAIQKAQGARGEFVLLLNPDTQIINNAIEEVVDYLRKNKKVGIAGCKILNPDRTLQLSVRRFPNFCAMFMIMLKLHYFFPGAKSIREYLAKDFDYNKEQVVDQVMGAFFMIRSELFGKIGLLDEHFYIWFEEVDFCRRTTNTGYQIMYLPQAKIIHHFAQSFNQVLKVRKQEIFNRSLLYYFRKHKFIGQYLILLLIYPFSLILAVFTQFFNVKRNES